MKPTNDWQALKDAGLSASQDAVELIAARVEGNLLAAAQEIEKLKLMAEGGQITVETVQGAVADSARFDVFGLVDAILNGEPAHALRMLDLVNRILQLPVEHLAVGDDDDAVVGLRILRVVQTGEPMREPRNAVRLPAAGGVLNEIIPARPFAPCR